MRRLGSQGGSPSTTVGLGESATFGPLSYSLTADDMPEAIGDTLNLINTVTAWLNGEIITQAMATVEVDSYGLCDTDEDPYDGDFSAQIDGLPCIWKPPPGTNWTISVVPDSPRPTRVMITVRDHIPGNWCPQGVREMWRPGDSPVQTTVAIPSWPPSWPADWAGDPVCPFGGMGGDFFNVGTLSSFYLAASGTVTVTPAP